MIFCDWFVRILFFSCFGFSALLLIMWALEDFDRPNEAFHWFKYSRKVQWKWISEIMAVVMKLALACLLGYVAVTLLMTRSDFRQKREGTIKPCPTCGQDYRPRK